jgi:hypothetical protein
LNNRKPNGYWTKEKCQEEALKYNSRFEFQRNSNGSYHYALRKKWLDEICQHMTGQTHEGKIWLIYSYILLDNHVYIG